MYLHSRLRRFIPRSVTRAIRNIYLRILDCNDVLSGKANDLIPPRSLHYVGGGDFKEIGKSFFEHFIKICQLKPDSMILDIGCGTGRMAVPLLDYLNESGSYCGFDISQKAITWCRNHITTKNPRFLFTYADIVNREYNPKGKISASDYIFPCSNEFIDFAFATSVFTHMRAAEVRQYLSEIRRTLKPQGKAMLTFYILDELAIDLIQNGKASMNFNIKLPDCFAVDEQTPERAIAYSESQLLGFLEEANLELMDPIYWGSWSGKTDALDFQDVIVVGNK